MPAVVVPGRAEREAAAVLVALAGPRRGEAWAVHGAGDLVRAALQAAAGPCRPGPVALAVAGAGDVPAAAAALRPGGRLVALAASPAEAAAAARDGGTTLLRVLPLPAGVAWLARRDL